MLSEHTSLLAQAGPWCTAILTVVHSLAANTRAATTLRPALPGDDTQDSAILAAAWQPRPQCEGLARPARRGGSALVCAVGARHAQPFDRMVRLECFFGRGASAPQIDGVASGVAHRLERHGFDQVRVGAKLARFE